jgi:cytochrome P450 family 3 subfamily A
VYTFDRFGRVASNDYQLGEYHIPKGMTIGVPVYPIHHDPHVWSEPEKFIPERYLHSKTFTLKEIFV